MRIETRVLVTGAGGFIGHALVNRLKAEGCFVRGVDSKYPEYESSRADEFEILDLRRWDNCLQATRGGIDQVTTLPPQWAASVITRIFTPTSPDTSARSTAILRN